MFDVSTAIRRLRRDESGQDLVEYALIVVFIALALTVAMLSFRGTLSGVFEKTSETVQTQNPTPL